MRRILIVLFILSLTGLSCVEVQIGSGTTQTRTPFDMYPDLSRCTSLYRSSEIGCALSISTLKWQVAVPSTRTVFVWIWLKKTTLGSVAQTPFSELVSGATIVYRANMSFCQNGWVQVSFSPFFYDGWDNLLLMIQTDGDPYSTQPKAYFNSHASGGTTVSEDYFGYHSPGIPYPQYNRPNIVIGGEAYTLPQEARNPSPTSGYNDVGASGSLSWTFGLNTSTYDLWFGPTGNLSQVVTGETVTGASGSYDFTDLTLQANYAWKVVSYNSVGESISGPVWTFITRNPPGVIGFGVDGFGSPFGYLNARERVATIYYPGEITLTGYLDRISWYCTHAVGLDINYKIYAKTVNSISDIAVPWNTFLNGATLIKQGTRNFNTLGWQEFALDTIYTYSTGNLVIAVETNRGQSGFMDVPRFRATYMGAPRSIQWLGPSNTSNEYAASNWLYDVALHLQPFGTVAPTLISPDTGSTELPIGGFDFCWNASYDAGQTQTFKLYVSDSNNQTSFFANAHSYTLNGTSFNPCLASEDPLTYNYGDHLYWTVAACAPGLAEQYIWPPRDFSIVPCYTEISFPYGQDFETWLPSEWSATGGTHPWQSYSDQTGNSWAMADSWASVTNASFCLTSPALRSSDQLFLGFLWSHKYNASYQNTLTIQISTDQSNWTDLWTLAGSAFDSNDGASNYYTAGSGTYSQIAIPTSYNNMRFWLRFRLFSPSYGPRLFIDDISLYGVNIFSAAVRLIRGLPDSQTVGASYTPSVIVENHTVVTCNFLVTLQIPGFYNESHWAYQLAAGGTQTIIFSNWSPPTQGPYTAVAFTSLEGEDYPGDDSRSVSFQAWTTGWETPVYAPHSCHDGSAASYHDASGNEFMITTGGQTPNNNFYVMKYNVRAASWSSLPQLPAGRAKHASAIVGGYIYIIGGSTTSVYRLNLEGGTTWEQVQSLPAVNNSCKAVAYLDRYIYVAGGYVGQTVYNSVLCYDTLTNIWSDATPMPGQAYAGAFAIQGSTLVYVGGWGISSYSAAVYKGEISASDPLSISWDSVRADNPFSAGSDERWTASPTEGNLSDSRQQDRHYPGGALMFLEGGTWGTDSVLITGGTNDIQYFPIPPTTAYLFNIHTNAWTPLPNLAEAVSLPYFATVQMEGNSWKAIVACGINSSGYPLAHTQTLSLDTTITLASPQVEVSLYSQYIRLFWDPVPGAYGGYRIETATSPSGPWSFRANTMGITWFEDPEQCKFYRVTALP